MRFKTESDKLTLDTHHSVVVTRGVEGKVEKVKGGKYMVMEDVTLGAEHIRQDTDVLSNCTLEAHITV